MNNKIKLFSLVLLGFCLVTPSYARNAASIKSIKTSAVSVHPTPQPPHPPTPPTPPQPPTPPTPPNPPNPPTPPVPPTPPNPPHPPTPPVPPHPHHPHHPQHPPRPPRPHLPPPVHVISWGTTVYISTGGTNTANLWAYDLYPQQKRLTGKGVKIAIADSGISSHTEFNGKDIQGADFTHSANIQDSKNHGTAIAGIIGARGAAFTGVAPDAELIVYKVDNGSRLISSQAVTAAINNLIDYNEKHPNDKILILNLSYGISGGGDATLTQAINCAYEAGILIVCPAGNTGFPGVYYPANLSTTIAVGSMADDGASVSGNSSYGKEVDFIAPGENIYTTDRNGRYSIINGTSASTAFVSASAALVVEGFQKKYGRYPTVDEIKGYLIKASVELPNVPREKQGYGFIDVERLEKEFLY